MGLDMYLGVRTSDGVEQVGYWRKANAIHGWFVRECGDNVDECQEIAVPVLKLLELQSQCLLAVKNQAKNKVIPTSANPKTNMATPLDGEEIGEWLAKQMAMETTIAVMEREFEDTSDPLRPTAGFFFGGTEKDEYYYADLMETVDIIAEAVIKYPNGEFIYQASW